MGMKNKKAQLGHAMTWLHKFFILVLVIGGVVAIVAAHYSQQFDIRDQEMNIIARKLIECIAPNGHVTRFDKEVIEDCFPFDEKEFFINISLENDYISIGDGFLEILCQAKEEGTKAKFYPACLKENYYVFKEDKETNLKIFIAIKKFEKNL